MTREDNFYKRLTTTSKETCSAAAAHMAASTCNTNNHLYPQIKLRADQLLNGFMLKVQRSPDKDFLKELNVIATFRGSRTELGNLMTYWSYYYDIFSSS